MLIEKGGHLAQAGFKASKPVSGTTKGKEAEDAPCPLVGRDIIGWGLGKGCGILTTHTYIVDGPPSDIPGLLGAWAPWSWAVGVDALTFRGCGHTALEEKTHVDCGHG